MQEEVKNKATPSTALLGDKKNVVDYGGVTQHLKGTNTPQDNVVAL